MDVALESHFSTTVKMTIDFAQNDNSTMVGKLKAEIVDFDPPALCFGGRINVF